MKTNRINTQEVKTTNHITTSKQKMLDAQGISNPTRKWLVGLAMVQDIRDYCRLTRRELKDEGLPIKDYDAELLEAIKQLQAVIYKYLNDQINISILGFGDDNVCETARI